MRFDKVISKRVRRQAGGTNVVADVNAAIAGGDGEGSTSAVSLSGSSRIVQRSGRARRTKSPKARKEQE